MIYQHAKQNLATTYLHDEPRVSRWPAIAITVWVGLFVIIVAGAWGWSHIIRAEPVDEIAWIILAATLLRVVTIGIAWSGVTKWGDALPAPLVTAGLWGAGSAQLLYPVAELGVKLLIVIGLLPETGRGIGNMSVTGWFNFAAAALVFGVPGALFMVEGFHQQRRRNVVWYWAVVGALLGIIFLFVLSVWIG